MEKASSGIVVDASPLIALAKMRRLEILRVLYGHVWIGPGVKEEVVDQGQAIAARGVELIEKALQEGWIQVVRLSTRERKLAQRITKASRLDAGETESLVLAQSRKRRVIVDDREARATAAAMGLELIGTAGVLLEGFFRGHLTREHLEDAVRELSRTIWLSPAVVAEILQRAREVRK